MNDIAIRRVDQNVLAVSVAQSIDRRQYLLNKRDPQPRPNSPEHEADHRHDGCCPTISGPRLEPCRWLWEVVQEPLVEDWREGRQNLVGEG